MVSNHTEVKSKEPRCLPILKPSGIGCKLSRRSKPHRSVDSQSPLWKIENDSDSDAWHPEEGAKRSADIDQYLIAESSKMKRHLKVLLLGCPDEVDIFWKQTRLLSEPLSQEEKRSLRPKVRKEIVNKLQSCLNYLHENAIKKAEKMEGMMATATATYVKQCLTGISNQKEEEHAREVLALSRDSKFHSHLHGIGLSWADAERITLASTQFSLLHCYCAMSNITAQLERVFAEDYEPTDHDYLHFDRRIYGIHVREAQVNKGTHLIRLLDVHGSGERKKWIHLFEEMKCLLFVADLASYDQVLLEDESCNQLQETIVLFGSWANARFFNETPLLLVMANAATFKAKLETRPLASAFPEYNGSTADEALEYMIDRFKRVACHDKVYACTAEISDPKSVGSVLDFMEKNILKETLADIGAHS